MTLHAHGKPMRALAALTETTPDDGLTEVGVYKQATRENLGENFHGALATLVQLGYARRIGRAGSYRWFITPAGRSVLRSTSEDGS